MALSSFDPALTHPIKWSVGENRFDEDGKNPKSLSLFVPLASAHEMANHLMSLAERRGDHVKTGKVWDFDKQTEIEVEGFYINAKGKDGQYGEFGNINPQKLQGGPTKPNF